jgi:hypothetical protein
MKDDRARLRVVRERRRLEVLLRLRLRAIEELADPHRPREPGADESDERASRRNTHLVLASVLRERLAAVARVEQRLVAGSYASLDAGHRTTEGVGPADQPSDRGRGRAGELSKLAG